jgi:hypothetical protein
MKYRDPPPVTSSAFGDAIFRSLNPEEQRTWRLILPLLKVREFDRAGERIIEITHRPTGLQVEHVRGADWIESYREAMDELIAFLEEEGSS